ncbi:MAG: hypothetical protein OIN86_04630 [Candidatus Methanoperedens sp.]|nr:hypothetical protein [Candidatus Methanoperedens sp.]CAG0996618.1 hypothetical protein METP1_02609 [Methanosarcinales archaeon]
MTTTNKEKILSILSNRKMTNTDNITTNSEKKILKNWQEILDAKTNEDFKYIEIPESEKMTTNKEKIIELLSFRSMSEATLSKKSGIQLTELRPILGELCDAGKIEHIGKIVRLKSNF